MANIKLLNSVEFFDSMSAAFKLLLLFIIGIGNYVTVLLLILFYSIKALMDYSHPHKVLKILFLPIFLLGLYFDFKYGQLWLVHKYNNLPIFIFSFLLIDYFTTKHINIIVEHISKGHVFSYCDNCKFENVRLSIKCNNCGYEKDMEFQVNEIDNSSIYDNQYYLQVPLLRHKLNPRTIDNLSLSRDEIICMSVNVSFVSGIYVDGIKKLCNCIVITNKNITFLQMHIFQRGWRWRDKINLSTIKELAIINKRIGISERQAITFKTEIHNYEFFLWPINKEYEQVLKHFNLIKHQLSMSKSSQQDRGSVVGDIH